jgi:hypothetical protein
MSRTQLRSGMPSNNRLAVNRNIAMDMMPLRVATIAADAEVDHAIATLVLVLWHRSGSALDV